TQYQSSDFEAHPAVDGAIMISVTRLLETALYVDDVDRSCEFYERVLGLGPLVWATAGNEITKPPFRPLHVPGGQVLLLFRKGSTGAAARSPGGQAPAAGRQWASSPRVRHPRVGAGGLERPLATARRPDRRRGERAARRHEPLLSRPRRSSCGTCHAGPMVDFLTEKPTRLRRGWQLRAWSCLQRHTLAPTTVT